MPGNPGFFRHPPGLSLIASVGGVSNNGSLGPTARAAADLSQGRQTSAFPPFGDSRWLGDTRGSRRRAIFSSRPEGLGGYHSCSPALPAGSWPAMRFVMESPVPSMSPADRPCLHCGAPSTYCRAAASVWRNFRIVRQRDGAVVALDPGREVPLCVECAEVFDPRCALWWNAPLWVLPLSARRVRGGSRHPSPRRVWKRRRGQRRRPRLGAR